MPAASGPSWIQASAGLAAGLGGLVVGVGDRVGTVRVGEATLGETDPPPNGCPVEQPTMANTTTVANLRFMSASLMTGKWVLSVGWDRFAYGLNATAL